jgi:hypothetical protein
LVNICNRMMAKRPDDRYQTAGDVAERLAEWLADRGIEVGDSGKKSGASGGIGSDVFRRFAASMQKPVGESHRAGASHVGRHPAGAAATAEPEEDIGLAPLEDDRPAKEAPTVVAPAATDVDTLPIPEPKPTQPRKSLFEEELEAGRALRPEPRVIIRREGEFNPLQPPGFVGPSYGTPAWVFVAVGIGVVAIIGVIIAILATGV